MVSMSNQHSRSWGKWKQRWRSCALEHETLGCRCYKYISCVGSDHRYMFQSYSFDQLHMQEFWTTYCFNGLFHFGGWCRNRSQTAGKGADLWSRSTDLVDCVLLFCPSWSVCHAATYTFALLQCWTLSEVNSNAPIFSRCQLHEYIVTIQLGIPAVEPPWCLPGWWHLWHGWWSSTLNSLEQVLNFRLSRARQVVDYEFGILASPFKVLKTSCSRNPRWWR